jgi:uncharacterized protein YndB with AHSA1/START domain
MPDLSHRLDRTVLIRAIPETVYRYFTDSARWANWWGPGSTIDATPGGKVYIRHPNGVEVSGEVLEVQPAKRIVFTYGYAGGKPMPPGGSRVTIEIEPDGAGTRLHLTHEFSDTDARDIHVQGWRFQLSLFGNVVANEAYAGARTAVDAWYRAWVVSDAAERDELLARTVTPSIRFRDRYSLLDGVADLAAHIAAAQRFMPGIELKRRGDVRHCQGTVLSDWVAEGPDGAARMSGSSVFEFHPDGRIDSVTGFTNA